jgi:hypothetical protein
VRSRVNQSVVQKGMFDIFIGDLSDSAQQVQRGNVNA